MMAKRMASTGLKNDSFWQVSLFGNVMDKNHNKSFLDKRLLWLQDTCQIAPFPSLKFTMCMFCHILL